MKYSTLLLWIALSGVVIGEPAWRVVNPNAPDTQFTKWRHKLACDRGNNCYVVSQTGRPNAYGDINIAKYSPAGVKLWERWVAGARDQHDEANAIALDSQSHLWVAGYVSSEDHGRDALLQRYTPDGELVFSHIRNGSLNVDDTWNKLVLGPDDTAYLVGSHDYVDGSLHADSTYVVAAVGPAGEQLWQQASRRTPRNTPNPVLAIQNLVTPPPAEPVSKLPRQNPKYVPQNQNQTGPVVKTLPELLFQEIGKQIGLPPRKSLSSLLVIYPEFTATTRGGMNFERYDLRSGTPLPAALGETGPRPHHVHRVDQVEAEADGSLTLLGQGVEEYNGPIRSWVWRLDSQLNPLWLTACPPANVEDAPLDLMCKAPDGSMYLGGWNRVGGNQSRARAMVVRLSPSGDQLWQRLVGRDQYGTMLMVKGMARRANGNLVLASSTYDMDSPPQVQGLVSEITEDGTVTTLDTWTLADYRFEGARFLSSSTRAYALTLAPDGSVFVAGEFSGAAFAAHILARYVFATP